MKLLHLHLKDVMGNPKTLKCILANGSIRYTMYGGHGSSGIGFSLSNIQFYKYDREGQLEWLRNASLPIENLPNETKEQFKQRVIDMLDMSTHKIVKVINTQVKFV